MIVVRFRRNHDLIGEADTIPFGARKGAFVRVMFLIEP